MKLTKSVFFVIVVLLGPNVAEADLARDIRAVLNDKYLSKASVSVTVARVNTSGEMRILFRHQSDVPHIPASNMKLITTAAALETLGPDFKFRTVLLLREGNLYLIGDGDPTLGDSDLLKAHGWDTLTVFNMWAEELKRRGVRSINNLFIDDSVFDEVFVHPSWSPRYASARYSAQVAGVNLNANCVDFFVRVTSPGQTVNYFTNPPTRYVNVRNTCVTGSRNAIWLGRELGRNDIVLRGEADANSRAGVSVTVHDPAMYAGTVLAETLASSGIVMNGPVPARRDRTVRGRFEADVNSFMVVAALETPLEVVLARANKESSNLYAEALCKRLGFAIAGAPGSWENGTEGMASFMTRIGVARAELELDDGCGLSRHNRVSSHAIVRLLNYMFRSTHADVYRESLGIAGADGTLRQRFTDTDLRGRVYAKSGYIDAVSALSGYVQARDGNWYAFSILMNSVPEKTNNTAKALQERIVRAIDRNAR